MAPRIIKVSSYSPKSGDVFFFDNCIWMFLYCPMGNVNKSKEIAYSSFLESIISSRATIFINSIVLSEFANRYLRLDFELLKKENPSLSNYKRDYVGSERYQNIVECINSSIKSILKVCEKTSDNFNCINIDKVTNHFKKIDFNDSYNIELSALNRYKFVTDDKDFISYEMHNVEIITENSL